MRQSKLVEYGSNAVTLFAIMFVVALGSAAAKEHKPKASVPASQVVAHIAFSGLSTVDMAMHEQSATSDTSMCSTRETKAFRLWISPNLPSRRSFESSRGLIQPFRAI